MFEEIDQIRNNISNNLSEMLELKKTVKNKELEKQDLMKDLFMGIIDVIDSFENKQNSLSEKYSSESENAKIIKSYSSIKTQLINLLKKYGVTIIEFPENRLITGFSKVVGTEPDPKKRNDIILEIVRNGYIRGHEVIREAEIIIVKN